jgi:hypothetical protein
MITATATGANGQQIILVGVTRENVKRLMKGQPIHLTAASHPGFPEHLAITICFGETERSLTEELRELIGPETKVIAVPKTPGHG